MDENMQAQLPLDKPREIQLKSKKGIFALKTRRVTAADWEKYFQGVVDQSMRIDGRLEKVYEADTALIELVDSVLISAEGYGELPAEWQPAVPIAHRMAVGGVLRTVAAQPDDSTPCGFVEVKLGAAWPAEGQSLVYEGLIHRFRHPGIAELKRFNFEASRVRVLGAGKDSVSIYPSRMGIAMKIYDELIESVDGYSVNGAALEGAENIKREMDGMHKATAALQLFLRDAEIEIQ